MNRSAWALTMILLSACAAQPSVHQSSGALPLAISQLTYQTDPATGQVDINLTIKSEYREPLKTVRVEVAAYDANGQKLSASDESIEVLGPIVRGQSIGPLDKVIGIQNATVACIEVVRVQIVKLDYTLDSVWGKEAQGLVSGGHPQCHK
ncbi:hypothetical protein [Pseudomonas sp. dw_358]|uniref:hypothetical protein n=1 Tax=Pseudomonas sp. dw_358 TaxID=2720083 RepID=UPI001BD5F239|nr:hypothetical protein [Pseudomonas sp. dw_358]